HRYLHSFTTRRSSDLRGYPYKDTLSSFLGSITSQDQGIPKEKEQYYLTKGYSRNDRVGRSGLEEQYEDVLRGRKEHIQYTTNKRDRKSTRLNSSHVSI